MNIKNSRGRIFKKKLFTRGQSLSKTKLICDCWVDLDQLTSPKEQAITALAG